MAKRGTNADSQGDARELQQLVQSLRQTLHRIEELTGEAPDAASGSPDAAALMRSARAHLEEESGDEHRVAELLIASFDAISAHVALVDANATIVAVNEPWRRFAIANGLQDGNFGVGRNYLDVCGTEPSDSVADIADGIRRVLSGERAEFSVEYPCHGPDCQRWFRVSATPVGEGSHRGAVVMHVNITERRLAEERLAQRERHYRALFESNPQPILVYDLKTLGILAANNAAVDQYGYSREEFLSMTIEDLHPAEEIDALHLNIAAVTEGIDRAGIWTHKRRDGSLVKAEIISHTVTWNRRPAEMVLAIDMTARLAAEDRLRESESLLRIAGEVSRLGAWRVDLHNMKMTWSDEVYAIHEIPPGTPVTPESGIEFYAPEYRDTIREAFTRCVEDGTPYDLELQIVTATGRRIWVRAIGKALRDAEGRIVRVHGGFQDISGQKAIEHELERKSDLMRSAGRLARVGGWTTTIASREVYWSDELCEMLGYPAGYVPSYDEALALYPEIWQEKIRAAAEECTQTGKPFRVDVQHQRRDGSTLFARISGELVRDAEGVPLRVQRAFQDVTHEVKALEAILESEERFRSFLRDVPTVAIQGCAASGRVLYWNKASEELYGYTEEEALGQMLFDLIIPPELMAYTRNVFAQIADEGSHVPPRELSLLRKDGSRVDVYCSHAVLRRRGKPTELYSVEIDLTEMKELSHRLAESEERFRLAALATIDTIYDWDLGADTLWWSQGMEAQFGYKPEEIVRDSSFWDTRIHPQDRGWVLADIEKAIQGDDQQWEARYRFRRADGTYAQVVDRGFLIRDETGKAVRIVGGMTDITEKLELEERLRQSQRLESIGQLTGGVAHDFNNLLTVILGNSELLREEVFADSDALELAQTIEEAAHRGAELTQQLLAFARRQALDPKVIDINSHVAATENLLRRTLGRGIDLHFVRRKDLWQALVDPTQLQNAILNLCLNARDAMPDGGRLTIETCNTTIDKEYAEMHEGLPPGEYVLVAVSDTGIGMTPGQLEHIFEPFFTTKGTGRGTGLGMSMVYGFVKQSRGHIAVYSEPGAGTTIKMLFPRTVGTPIEHGQDDRDAEVPTGTESILFVEDDEMVRQYALNQLELLGYHVIAASGPQDALEVLKRNSAIDLLFTDGMMPGGMNGPQLAEKATAMRPGLKVLYCSGYTENAIVHHGRLDEGAQLLGKPYTRRSLAQKIREVLDQGIDNKGAEE